MSQPTEVVLSRTTKELMIEGIIKNLQNMQESAQFPEKIQNLAERRKAQVKQELMFIQNHRWE